MILQALIDYYTRLEKDSIAQQVAAFGFSRQKISFCVVLNADGALSGDKLEDLRLESDKKWIARRMEVPDRGGRTGRLIKPNFLWDNTGYALGHDRKGKPVRSQLTFEAFRSLHRQVAEQVDEPGLIALCRFLDRWDPKQAESLANWEEACGNNVVFRLRREQACIHESRRLQEAWGRFVAAETGRELAASLTTGEEENLARLHPMIRGVTGAKSSGAALVSFNQDSFTSYGKTQSHNAPMGVQDAFRYTTALNRLLSDRQHRVRIGDATVVFWSDRPTPFEDAFELVVNEPRAGDTRLNDRVRDFLERLKRGRFRDDSADAQTRFYVLGLSPNASRLSVRFWLASTVGELASRLAQHAADLEMTGARRDDPPLVIRRLLMETARVLRDKPDAETIPPLLAGAVARAVLSGEPYPQMMFNTVIQRIRSDRRVGRRRAAILKAFLVRRARWAGRSVEVPVSLNLQHPDPAYHLGRLFAVLEKLEENVLGPKLSSTIKLRYLGTASATPATVFPRLMRLSQHYLAKVDRGGRIYHEKLLQEINSHLERFPAHLGLEKQGLFHIGYYHQRQAFFEKKTDRDSESEPPTPEE